jgi:hypothetical protein
MWSRHHRYARCPDSAFLCTRPARSSSRPVVAQACVGYRRESAAHPDYAQCTGRVGSTPRPLCGSMPRSRRTSTCFVRCERADRIALCTEDQAPFCGANWKALLLCGAVNPVESAIGEHGWSFTGGSCATCALPLPEQMLQIRRSAGLRSTRTCSVPPAHSFWTLASWP